MKYDYVEKNENLKVFWIWDLEEFLRSLEESRKWPQFCMILKEKGESTSISRMIF